MIAYLDSSALVRLALREPGFDALQARLTACESRACHAFGYVELRSAAWRAVRFGSIRISAEMVNDAVEQAWSPIQVIELDSATIRRAGAMAERHQLRAFDAVHLAAAESLQRDVGKKFLRWFCFDAQLNQAAAAIGLVDGLALDQD